MPSRRPSAPNRFEPRRAPRQQRSQRVFDRIIQTAKALFEKEGYAYVSTNRIAEKAGLSIGSLYQYFANRESIALAVYEEACSRAALTLKRAAFDALALPFALATTRNIECTFNVFERDRYALLKLIGEIPALRSVAQPVSFETLIQHATRMYLEQRFPRAEREAIGRKAYVIVRCVLGTVSRYLDDPPGLLDRAQVITELSTMVGCYAATLAD